MSRFTLALLLAAVFAAAPTHASDIKEKRVAFPKGKSATTIKDSIVGRESIVYRLGAEAGQTMTIRLKSSNRATSFNVYEPGRGPGDLALASGDRTGPMVPELNRFEGELPTSGEYAISVYLLRSAARRNERSTFSLDVAISALPHVDSRGPVKGDYADGLQGGPDYWKVSQNAPAGGLALRAGASMGAKTIERAPTGSALRNLGCRMAEGERWCKVQTLGAASITAWTPGRFLSEGSAPPQAPPATGSSALAEDALVPGTDFHATGSVPCARAAGQPMGSCEFGVKRTGAGGGVVTVFWPGGGNRVIFFEKGKPTSFDRSQADGKARMRVRRNVDLFMIDIGSERFEIPEAVITGG